MYTRCVTCLSALPLGRISLAARLRRFARRSALGVSPSRLYGSELNVYALFLFGISNLDGRSLGRTRDLIDRALHTLEPRASTARAHAQRERLCTPGNSWHVFTRGATASFVRRANRRLPQSMRFSPIIKTTILSVRRHSESSIIRETAHGDGNFSPCDEIRYGGDA